MSAGYETLIVTFSDPIKVLDNMFADADAWGTDSLKGWVEDYESTRFTQINGHTAVITSEYNMPCVKKHEVYADKRAYGSHHFRIQHALRKGMAHTLHGYR